MLMENKLSKCINGSRKSHGSHHLLNKCLENWKNALGKYANFQVLFMDLSKSFDTANYGALLAKKAIFVLMYQV